MNHNISYCTECLEPIGECGAILLGAYEAICEFYVECEHGMPIIEQTVAPGTMVMVKFLERKGMIVTTERLSYLVAKPTNHNFSHEKGHLFCSCPRYHCPRFVESVCD